MERTEFYQQNIEHYYRRWRDTELIIQRRSQAWITGFGLASAIFTFGGTVIGPRERSVLWALSAIFSVGMFLRLIAARQSIIRSIAIINVNRRQYANELSGAARSVADLLNDVDTGLPKRCKIFTSSSAAAIFATFSAYMSIRIEFPNDARFSIFGAAGLLLSFVIFYVWKCKKLKRVLEAIGSRRFLD